MTLKLTGRITDLQTNRALPGLRIELWSSITSANEPLTGARGDRNGRFHMKLGQGAIKKLEEAGYARLEFRVYQGNKQIEVKAAPHVVYPGQIPDKVELIVDTSSTQPSIREAKLINEAIGQLPKTGGTQLPQLAEILHIDLPQPLLFSLAQHGIQTIEDIRMAGGLSQVEGLPLSADDLVVQTLDAHAALSCLSSDVQVNAELIKKGYTSVQAIAAVPRTIFVTAVGDTIGDVRAAQLHAGAQAQASFLKSILIGFRADAANRYMVTPASNIKLPSDGIRPIPALPRPTAVSPLAYLADLLSYTLKHVKVARPTPGGLLGYYYDGVIGVSHLVFKLKRRDPCINFDWGVGSPDPSIAPVTFSVVWEGKVVPRYSEDYMFSIISDGGVKLGVGNQWGIENWRSHTQTRDSGVVTLQAKVPYDISLEYYNDQGAASVQLLWKSKSQQEELIPPEQLCVPPDTDLDVAFLTDTFLHQPLAALPAESEMQDQQVRQVRLCIEALRSYLGNRPLADTVREQTLATEEKEYCQIAYTSLLSQIGTSYEEIRLARAADRDTRNTLADRLGVDLKEVTLSSGAKMDTLAALHLDMGAVTEPKLEELFGLRDTSRDPLQADRVPALQTWRLEHLRTLWKEQDKPIDLYSEDFLPEEERLPIIDPDIIGPDDFRDPKANQNSPNTPFAVWLKRRQWIDQQLEAFDKMKKTGKDSKQVPDLAAMFDAMDQPMTGYQPITGAHVVPWAATTRPADFDALAEKLVQGEDVAETKERLHKDLRLTVESFSQLVATWTKDREAVTDDEQVTDDEWQGVYAILTQAMKEALFPSWRKEEEDLGILLGPQDFWISVREPREGAWPPKATSSPVIDPDLLTLEDLPDSAMGEEAISKWEDRRDQLKRMYDDLKKEREAKGFDAMLCKALGDTNPSDPQEVLSKYLERLFNDLQNKVKIEDIQQEIQDSLFMSAADFTLLMTVRANSASTDPKRKGPTTAEYARVYGILTRSQKKRTKYTSWYQEEQPLAYWIKLKARLPRWRAPVALRQQWQQALSTRSSRPIVDPDVIGLDDLNIPIQGDPVFDLWYARNGWLAQQLQLLYEAGRAAPSPFPVPGPVEILNAMLQLALGVPSCKLGDLANERQKGRNITGRLDQLGLNNAMFSYLLRVTHLAEMQQPLLDIEWDVVNGILRQVMKERQFAVWHKAEQDVMLGPDSFQISTDDAPLLVLSPQLRESPLAKTIRDARRDWKDTLQSRIDQQNAVINDLQQAIGTTEEADLPLLRDALIRASAAAGTSLEEKAKWLAAHLFIDTQNGGRQMTTRVAQAIETLQSLLWSLRTGQPTDLELVADQFEEEWKWIGSYATWRAAMFVFMYPENVLLPSLRQKQTPAFRQLVTNLRSNPNLLPERVAKQYAKYFEDICSLTIEATCQSTVSSSSGPHTYFYLFGRGGATNTVYWSVCDREDDSPYSQTFWEAVPVQGIENVTALIGAVPYRYEPDTHYIALFVRVKDKEQEKLAVAKYDLKSPGWKSELSPLDLPENATSSFTAVILRGNNDEYAFPSIVVQAWSPSGLGLYMNSLNVEGTGWRSDWSTRISPSSKLSAPGGRISYDNGIPWEVDSRLAAAIGDTPDRCAFLWVPRSMISGTATYRLDRFIRGEGFHTDLQISLQLDGEFLSAFPWPGTNEFLLFSGSKYRFIDREDGSSRAATTAGLPSNLVRIIPTIGDPTIGDPHGKPFPNIAFTYQVREQEGRHVAAWYYSNVSKEPSDPTQLFWSQPATGLVPLVAGHFDIVAPLSEAELQNRAKYIETSFSDNKHNSRPNLTYLEEAYYFVPVYMAFHLQRQRQYTAALDWFRLVYDYSAPLANRKIYYGLKQEETLPDTYERALDWLLDPLNPHAIAEHRCNTYTRYTVLTLISCMLDYADAEFTTDTSESLQRARMLYTRALELLNETPELKQQPGTFEIQVGLLTTKGDNLLQREAPHLCMAWSGITQKLLALPSSSQREDALQKIEGLLATDQPWTLRLARMKGIIAQVQKASARTPSIADILHEDDHLLEKTYPALLSHPAISSAINRIGTAAASTLLSAAVGLTDLKPGTDEGDRVGMPAPRGSSEMKHLEYSVPTVNRFLFDIPSNPVLDIAHLRAELNLYKLRNGRNIAGMERQVEAYAAPTDATSGMPGIGAGGQFISLRTTTFRPTPYRYKTLIERAKQIAQLAQQLEAAMLSALVNRDNKAYELLKARQDLSTARSGVRLQDLHVTEANSEVQLATLQKERASIQKETYKGWIEAELNQYENEMITFYTIEGIAQVVATFFEAGWQAAQAATTAAAGGATGAAPAAGPAAVAALMAGGQFVASSVAILARTQAEIASVYASYERRKQEWELNKSLAEEDEKIGDQQIKIANDRVNIATQERDNAQLQVNHAEDVVNFLTNEFTNVDLYDWMSRILEQIYSFFLQQATAVARLAEDQLAFERHEVSSGFIQPDYWEAPEEDGASNPTAGAAPNRRGLTGAERLLQDIYNLDQHAFLTDQRKLQLSKTISLVSMAPAEFQHFRETGILTFATPMSLFDADFPGHYLRLIKRVRTSVVALIPPVQGIHATLSTTGLSRVVVGGDVFQTVTVRRQSESVALTSPMNATGVFELESQSEMLLPFEAMGVDTTWEFRMPKAANQFDYRAVADVLITLDYTALDSFDYRRQVLQQLDSRLQAERAFSFRQQFVDQWYDLHNPDQAATPLVVRFHTRREDFPPNLQELKIQAVLLYFSRTGEQPQEVAVDRLSFTASGAKGPVGGSATSVDGIISTRKSNASSWMPMLGKTPVGEWELAFPNTEEMKNRFKNGETADTIEDILLVISYVGQTPAWPG